jgi:histone H3/H4
MSMDLERSPFGRIARKPASMLLPDRLTVKVTVRISEAAASALQINNLEGSLMIE